MSAPKAPDSTSPESLDALFERVAEDVAAEQGLRARMRGLSRSQAGMLVVGLGLGLVGGWLAFAPRADFSHYPMLRLLLETGALALLAASAGWSFVTPLSRAEPSANRLRIRMLAHLLVAVAIVSAPPAHMAEPYVSMGTGSKLLPHALSCLAVGSSVAIPVVVLMWLVDRGGRSEAMRWLAPLGAWMAGMAALQLHCPILTHEHQWAGHFAVLAPVTLCWFLLGRGRGRVS
jgi:hypothetical protein